MADLSGLDGLAGDDLGEVQVKAILNQIDLDIANLVRDGKLAALKYNVPGAAGRGGDRAANLSALLAARKHYEDLLRALPAEACSRAEFEESARRTR
ncbi:MAG: hypothetical protein AAF532_02825 [Planctomycetota bacterium]